ncbi:MAG: sn-glycerol-1-phosphate dehydrogenase [Desulfobacteraceae bacterium]|nr:sn-glycerol-1-phosphate dehydrogenase [Desulfobacteraceae bacterium]
MKNHMVDSKKCDELCTCGNRHTPPEVEVCLSEDAYSVLAADCKKAVNNASVLLIEDENTHFAAGTRVLEFLQKNSVKCKSVKLPSHTKVTDKLAEQIYKESLEHALIIAVGAGAINDLGKYAASKRNMPYWAVPTAPSMNGYTSAIAAVTVEGVKRTLPATPPRYIYVDPDVIHHAPLRLRQSGFCDLLAKSVSDFDWKTESLLFGGSYCDLPSAIVSESESSYIDHPEKIRQGDEKTVTALSEGLLISGIAMTLAGSSAPASGGEHLISHFLDMRESLTKREPDLHGLQVGLGVVFSALCYQKLASLKEKDLKNAAENIFQADADMIPRVWDNLAPDVEKQFFKKRTHLLELDRLLPKNWQALRALFSKVRKPDFFIDLIRRTGFEFTLKSLNLTKDEFLLAALSARTIRERITVLDISAHAGILKDAAEETLEMLE